MNGLIPKSPFLIWHNLGLALVAALLGVALGFYQGLAAQIVILATIGSFAILFGALNYIATIFEARHIAGAGEEPAPKSVGAGSIWSSNQVLIVAMGLLLLAYLIIAASVPVFRTVGNLVAFLLLELILIFAFKVSRRFVHGRSAFIGLIVLVALIVISSFTIDAFLSGPSIKAILLFASFLGIACVGQTLVALLGGLDLSIPYVVGASNIGMLYLIGLGVPSWVALGATIVAGVAFGFMNGVLTYRLQGQALILTLGTGFALAGLVQIITSIGSSFSGNVFGTVPDWLRNLAAMNGETFGLAVPPTILVWIAISVIVIIGLRYSAYGRQIYALGGNRRSAKLIGVSEFKYWTTCYAISGGFAGLPAPRLVRRRLHRRGQSLSFHDARRGCHRRNFASWRLRRLRVHGHRRARAAGVDRLPDRNRAQVRVAAVHLRPADPPDGRPLRPLSAHSIACLRTEKCLALNCSQVISLRPPTPRRPSRPSRRLRCRCSA